MRRFTTATLAARIHSSVPARSYGSGYLAQKEYNGDPGPSTLLKLQCRHFSATSIVQAGGPRPKKPKALPKPRASSSKHPSTGYKPSSRDFSHQGLTPQASPTRPASANHVPSVDRSADRIESKFTRGGTFTRPDVLIRAPKDPKNMPQTHARRSSPAYFQTETPFIKPKLHFGLTKSSVTPSVQSSVPRWKLDPLIHGRPLSKRETQYEMQKSPEEIEQDKEIARQKRNKFQQIERSERPTGHQGDAYETSSRLAEWMNKHPNPTNNQVDGLVKMMTRSSRDKVNVVVWNQVLGILGRHGMLDRMWKALQDMKKRGVDPNTRSYTIMLNAYAGTSHSDHEAPFTPMKKMSDKAMTRIITTYNASQAYVAGCIKRVRAAKAEGDKDDLAVLGDEPIGGDLYRKLSTRQKLLRDDKEQISVAATNAYIKLLGRFGLWEQLDNVYLAMDKDGPLSPNARTYSILFSALLNRMAQQSEKRYSEIRDELPTHMSVEEFGSRARSLWDGAVRQFHPIEKPKGYQWDKTKRIDEDLALLAIKALLQARPEDQRLALALIPFLWKLPEPTAAAPMTITTATASPANVNYRPMTSIPAAWREIPMIRPTPKFATLILVHTSKANKQTHAALWARALLDREELKRNADFGFFRAVIHCLASDGDTAGIADIMNSYQPPTGAAGWHIYIWENALMAARKSADWESALQTIRRMAHVPYGVEDGVPESKRKPYKWTPPGGKPKDVQGHSFIKPDPISPSPKCLSLLFKTAFGAGNPNEVDRRTRQAYNIFSSYPMSGLFTIPDWDYKRGTTIKLLEDNPLTFSRDFHPSLHSAAEWRLELAKDVRKASELLSEKASPEEKAALDSIHAAVSRVLDTWGRILDPVAARRFGGRAIGLRNRASAPASVMPAAPSVSGIGAVELRAAPAKVGSTTPRRVEREEEITDINQLMDGFDEYHAAFGEEEEDWEDFSDDKDKSDKTRWERKGARGRADGGSRTEGKSRGFARRASATA